MSEIREQVFVSSTYLDLLDERQAVIQVLLGANCIPAGMELFPASNDDRWNLIKRVIDGCDYYLLIVGGRYGSVDQESELSFTEMEYDYAEETGKPILAFLHGAPGKIERDKTDVDSDLWNRLEAFRSRVEAQHIVKFWHTASDLPGQVALALIDIRRTTPAVGWVRGDQALTPETTAELAGLRAEKAELQMALSLKSDRKLAVPPDIAGGEDLFRFFISIRYKTPAEAASSMPFFGDPHEAAVFLDVSWNAIFGEIGPVMLDEAAQDEISTAIRSYLFQQADAQRLLPQDFGRSQGTFIATSTVDDVIVQLFALGLIDHGTKRRSSTDKNKYWVLTRAGEDQLMKLRAARSPRSST
jgi:Domain of unknown function (DUF4062)